HASIGARTVPLLGYESVRGNAAPVVVTGRLPIADDEIAFGRETMRQLATAVGRSITLDGATGRQTFRVTGRVVVPGLGSSDGVGKGSVLTFGALKRLNADATTVAAAFRVHDRLAAEAALADVFGGQFPSPTRPEAVVNVDRVRTVPFVLAAVLAALT